MGSIAEFWTIETSPPPVPAKRLELRGAESRGKTCELSPLELETVVFPKIFSNIVKNFASACGRLKRNDSKKETRRNFSFPWDLKVSNIQRFLSIQEEKARQIVILIVKSLVRSKR
ncbi:hypothetical protein A3B18_03570 [Candidatus Giovannonibacteria bacterium RIFCSPLOWO2_01_FULL_46_13]|uniref:Uncharacterized protein n=1 Tax=Candidatus Giovannonibacteria bacterium RIFCSPLOWO2_01_FULL_46_13 TaxID=1798352 RepID=A0A1F5X3D9_9BACT|nr:MAG: hypothetical protein A3B18_03570 [Candidatus Giovannonibacteria bacterium RIFCSPLOWO2_01_FULL_46_13]